MATATMSRARTAGAAVLVLVMLVCASACSVGTFSVGSKKTEVTAYFTDTAGVFVGNDVGVLGVPIGKITSIVPEGPRVKVTMEVDGDQPIPAGAAAVVVPRSVATDRYIELTPVYRSGPRMQSGAVIPVDRTRTPVEFDEVLASLSKLANGLSGKASTRNAIKRLLDTQSTALRGKGDLINRSIRSLAAAANGISAQRQNATSSLVALDKLTQTLATNQGTVRKFIKQVASASSLLASERQNFRTSLRSVTRMIRVVAQFAKENRGEINTTVRRTNDVMRTVLDKRRSVGEVLRVMPLAVQNLERMLGPGNRLVVRLDITKLLPVIGPLLSQICTTMPGDLCNAIGLDPNALSDVLGNLLGGAK